MRLRLCACLASSWFQNAIVLAMIATSITCLGVLTACTALPPKLATTETSSLVAQTASVKLPAIDQRGEGRSTQGPGPKSEDAPWLTSD